VSPALVLFLFGATGAALLAGFPVAFTLAGVALVCAGIGVLAGVFDPAMLMAFPSRIFGIMTNEVLIAVPLFVFMGVMLERSKVAEALLDSMAKLFGRRPGGLGVAVTVVGALLAASTGIVGATVVTMGLLSLPSMLRRGYDPKLAAGAICAAGTLGQIIPPSIVLVLLGDVISSAYQEAQLAQGIFSPETVSVGDLFAGALLPGLGLVGFYLLYLVGRALLDPKSSPAMSAEELGEIDHASFRFHLLRVLAPPLLLIVAVLGSILAGIATPTEAAAVGAIGATLLAGLRQVGGRGTAIYAAGLSIAGLVAVTVGFDLRLDRTEIALIDRFAIVLAVLFCLGILWGLAESLRRLVASGVAQEVVRSTLRINSMVFVILIGASLFSLVFRGLGGDDLTRDFLSNLPGGVVGATALVMLVMFLLGFFLDFIEIIFVVVPIVAPVLLLLGLDPVWLGVMMAINLQTSFLTPPFGFALFYLRGVAPPEVTTADIYRGVVPFVALQLVMLLLLAVFPEIVLWLPRLIYG
jgi:TRAP-type mannitol/chloroaromatic compound transport system permease large subunit